MQEKQLLDLIRESNLSILRAMHIKLNSDWNFHSTGTPHSRLYYVIDGGGFLKTKNQYIEMKPGYVYLIPPNLPFSCGCDYLEKIFFHFNVTTVEKYDLFLHLNNIYSLPFSAKDTKEILKLMNSSNYIDIMKLKLTVLKTIINFNDTFSFDIKAIKKHSKLIQSTISFIENNTSIKLTAKDISKELFVSESKLRNEFLKEMEIPIGKYIDDMIFIKARQMLSVASNTISSVSSAFGFCDQFYFSRRFKEKFGITPTNFRKKNKIY